MTRLKVQLTNGILNVVLARPAMRNAFDIVTIEELTGVFTSCGRPGEYHSARALVLSGEGASFCSGADLGYMESMSNFSLEENRKDADRLFAMFESVRACAVPVVVVAHGHAMGGALGIAACADVTLAVTGTQMRFSEVRLGILPAVISPFVLQKMSASWARRWMMTGELFDADQAKAAGLFQFVGSATEVETEKKKVLTAILEAAPMSVVRTKALLNEIGFDDPLKVRDKVAEAIAELRASDEGKEGLSAFLNKREPKWRT